MAYLNNNTQEFYNEWKEYKDSIEAELRNSFQDEDIDFYAEAAWQVFIEHAKEGESIPNCINKLYR
jgi:hypothetical protein